MNTEKEHCFMILKQGGMIYVCNGNRDKKCRYSMYRMVLYAWKNYYFGRNQKRRFVQKT